MKHRRPNAERGRSRPATAHKQAAPRRSRSRRTVILGILLCLGAGLVWMVYNLGSDKEPKSPATDRESAQAPQVKVSSAAPTDAASADLNAQGSALLQANDPAGAVRVLTKAVELSPKDEDLHFNLAIAYSRMGDVTNAELHYREALRLLPDYPEAHNNYANLLMRAKRLEEAEQHLIEAVTEMPEYAEAYNNLGVVQQHQRRTAEALTNFQKAVEIDTNYWQGHFNLASVYLKMTNQEKAIEALRATLRIKPDFEPAQKALAKALGQTSNSAPAPP